MDESRAQSNPIAVTLLTGLVVTGALTVVVFGGGVIDEVSNSAATERAAQEMTQFASETAAVALGGSDRRRVDFSATEGTLSTQPDASWICIQNGSAAAADRQLVLPESDDLSETCEDNRTAMGAAVYDTGDGRVAYEGGGVWTSDADGNSRMVSPPEFHYRGDTLTLPVVQLDGDVRVSGPQVRLVATAGETDRVNISNPLPEDSGSVYVTVGSEFYQAWGRFIADRTDGRVVQFDHDNETVTVELVVPSPVTIENAVYSSGQGSNAVQVQNLDIDSYDTDEYSSSNAKESGDVVTDGGISPIEGTIDGDVYTVRNGKKIKMTSGGRVNGNVYSQKRVVVDSGVVDESIFAEDAVEFKGQEVGESVHADGKVTLGSSGLTVGDEVRTTGDLSFGSSGVTVDGNVHAAKLKSLGQSPDLNGDVYTSGFYGERGNRVGVPLSGELHAGDGIYTDGTEIDGAAYTDGDLEDTDSVYGGEVHVGGNADLSGTEVSKTVYVAGNAELGSATIEGDLHVGGDLTCPESNTVKGSVNVDGTVADGCSLDSADPPSVMAPTSPDDPKPPKSPDQPTPDPPKIEVPPEDDIDPVPEDAGCTNGGTIQVGSSGEHCKLPPGTYKVSKLDIDNGDLTFEQGGRVELYVEGDVSLSGSDGTVTTAPGSEHDATRVEINVIGDSTVDIQGMSFTGVINAPKSTVDMDEDNGVGAEVFGAVVAETVQGDNGAQIHYDEELSGQTVGDGKNGTTSVQYLHVTRNEMTIED